LWTAHPVSVNIDATLAHIAGGLTECFDKLATRPKFLDSTMTEIVNDLNIVKATEIFLVPASILVGALGVAQTEGLKTGISALALILSLLWGVCILDAYRLADSTLRSCILIWMPALFLICWSVSFVFHGRRYWRQRPTK
jgi:hypothetical protein